MTATWSSTPDAYARPMLIVQTSPPIILHRNPYRADAPPPPPDQEVPEMGPLFKRWSS